ncbi:precorrin-6y C5,15-methyltransferase (decarboxylating) subunit CbiE [Brevibacillus laterosporus]|uniref:precorrin-6y C5,15-methyltransferase (decarboxylating) subunit CbiE n=1 Tax=Brevibacillus laterosporus TaxID=1465 RepID=UPI0026542DCB|nr:precorrin-6y C5,15-methyltransferase (decarboxylating) subunit CbiE [Brevibacillus laterosporus]MDN9008706.1 precorrin-6y C5,15-methyltransferase (decarboxylating) subunit CbiE [Brevibacillus laterosporus]MDO0939792.1 precorrin-6y C5,15-methyltransferase (decarboxylating) subunit CbiE [Brevibacillus laterosporus]
MTQVTIIGIGDDGAQGLFPQAIELVKQAQLLVGGERHLAFFPDLDCERFALKSGVLAAIGEIKQAVAAGKEVVVLASGDPLFYGIGGLLTRKLGRDVVQVIPHLSSLQLAFSKMKEAWQDAHIDSVHGRPMLGLAQRLNGKSKVALLTDKENTPAKVAQYLLRFGMDEYEAFVAERLGNKEERCRWFTLVELAETECDPLNVMILKRKENASPVNWTLGIPDEEFAQRKPDKGLITKKEVRVASLAELQIKPDSIVWDIGTATGSVAIEAAKLAPLGAVYAVEKNEPDLENARANMYKFRTDITFVHAKAPVGLDEFPDPDAIFVGGSGGELTELVQLFAKRLRPGGRVVINAVTIENLADAMQACKAAGFDVSVTMLQVSRSKPILHLTRLEGLNPVYIITAKHKAKEENKDEQHD